MSTQAGESIASRVVTGMLLAALVVAGVVYRDELVRWYRAEPVEAPVADANAPAGTATSAATSDGAIAYYTCSMHPSVHQHGPGKCPICGMELVPVTVAQQRDGVVMIDEARRQLIGVRTAPLAEAPLRHVFHALGKITYDESSFTDVNLKVSGWITKLLVSQTGQRVTRGQTLFMLYSPDLYSAQQDFLLAQRTGKLEALVHAARKRLSLLGLTDKQIDAIAAGAEPIDTLPIASPATGFVIEKNVVEGASVQASAQLYRIAALDRVWVEADVYEQDLPLVRVGQAAKVTLDYLPGRAYDAKVAYVYPYVESAARTGRVRIELANKELDLRPGMYARVELATDLGARLQVPTSAVVYTGPRRLLFVDVGDGRFAPREIRTGLEADGMYEVLDGVKAGEVVAVSGTFLIAAEARIATTAKYWDEAAPPPVAAPEPPSKLVAPTPPPHNASAKPEPPVPAPARAPASAPTPQPAPTSMPAPEPPPPSAAPAVEYTCPMHPEVRSATPGTCPKCGMTLVPVSPRSTAP